jgi:hypothetical protein
MPGTSSHPANRGERSVISDSNAPLENHSPRSAGTGLATRPVDPALEGNETEDRPNRSRAELWAHRVLVLLFVFVCAVIGVLLVILPWHAEWTDNPLLLNYPALRSFMSHNFVRGLFSGLGILDIWIGFWEAVHYREDG